MAYQAGGSDLIRAGGNPMGNTTNLTLMCWAYLNSSSESGTYCGWGGDQNTFGGGVSFAVGGTTGSNVGNNFFVELSGIAWWQTTTASATGWNHLAMVNRGGDNYFYLNGEFTAHKNTAIGKEVATESTFFGDTSDPTVGARLDVSNRTSSFKAWSRALTTAEVQVEMSSAFPVFLTNLSVFWLSDKSGGYGTTNLVDYTQAYSTATSLIGTPTWADNPPVARC